MLPFLPSEICTQEMPPLSEDVKYNIGTSARHVIQLYKIKAYTTKSFLYPKWFDKQVNTYHPINADQANFILFCLIIETNFTKQVKYE